MDVLQSLYILAIATSYGEGVDTLGFRAIPIGRHYTRGDVGSDSETEIAVDGIYGLVSSFEHTDFLVVSVARCEQGLYSSLHVARRRLPSLTVSHRGTGSLLLRHP